MQVVGIIPARYGSTRLEGKPLVDILGKPMIQHVCERAQESECLSDVLVATDDARVLRAVAAFGGKAVMTSPAHLSGTDRVAEAAEKIDADVVFNIQGDEPLMNPCFIAECLTPFRRDPAVQIATLMKEIKDQSSFSDPAVVKVVRDLAGRALYFTRSLVPFPRNPGEHFRVFEHLGIYAFTKECLLKFARLPQTPLEAVEGLEQLRALEHGIPIHVEETQCASELVSVDTPLDLERVRRILSAQCVG